MPSGETLRRAFCVFRAISFIPGALGKAGSFRFFEWLEPKDYYPIDVLSVFPGQRPQEVQPLHPEHPFRRRERRIDQRIPAVRDNNRNRTIPSVRFTTAFLLILQQRVCRSGRSLAPQDMRQRSDTTQLQAHCAWNQALFWKRQMRRHKAYIVP